MINKPFEEFSNEIFNKDKNFIEINKKINNKSKMNKSISKCFILLMICIISIGIVDFNNIKLMDKKNTESENVNINNVINFNSIEKNDTIFIEDINSRK